MKQKSIFKLCYNEQKYMLQTTRERLNSRRYVITFYLHFLLKMHILHKPYLSLMQLIECHKGMWHVHSPTIGMWWPSRTLSNAWQGRLALQPSGFRQNWIYHAIETSCLHWTYVIRTNNQKSIDAADFLWIYRIVDSFSWRRPWVQAVTPIL